MNRDEFVQCMKTQASLDLEAWDVALLEPLKDLYRWWTTQSDTTKLFTGWLLAKSSPAFTRWVARVAAIADAEVGVALSEAIAAVTVGIALGTFMDVLGRCTIIDLEEPSA